MTISTLVAPNATSKASSALAIFVGLVLGFSTIFVVGHLQTETLHDAAHDVRHATGFPCH
ncbi:MAG: CbtB-domain containing protein [Alphaproteobacteria bacterium]|nr:CbtB-domain containing protein [Alphaproteobacteria bacterium]